MECPVCRSSFNSEKRSPRIIYPCGHSVCQSCLALSNICPCCNGEINDTAVNYSAIPVDEKEISLNCENCDAEAIVFCEQCKASLCKGVIHYRYHHFFIVKCLRFIGRFLRGEGEVFSCLIKDNFLSFFFPFLLSYRVQQKDPCDSCVLRPRPTQYCLPVRKLRRQNLKTVV